MLDKLHAFPILVVVFIFSSCLDKKFDIHSIYSRIPFCKDRMSTCNLNTSWSLASFFLQIFIIF